MVMDTSHYSIAGLTSTRTQELTHGASHVSMLGLNWSAVNHYLTNSKPLLKALFQVLILLLDHIRIYSVLDLEEKQQKYLSLHFIMTLAKD